MDSFFEALVGIGICAFVIVANVLLWLSIVYGAFWIANHFGVI